MDLIGADGLRIGEPKGASCRTGRAEGKGTRKIGIQDYAADAATMTTSGYSALRRGNGEVFDRFEAEFERWRVRFEWTIIILLLSSAATDIVTQTHSIKESQ